jgi:pyruvate dehydrogenase E2 component (dihydrolipoamide acetyltransferase)
VSQVVRLPEVLTGMSEATLTTWHVQVGEEVRPGEPLVEIETDKASVEYVADVGGVLAEHLVELASPVAVGTPIVLLATDGESVEQARAAAAGTASERPAPEPVPDEPQPTSPPGGQNGDARPLRLRASPLVRRLARDRGLNLSTVTGSGPGGRIVRRDLARLDAATEPAAAEPITVDPTTAEPTGPANLPPGVVAIPHTTMRRAIAHRLTGSKSTVPHFYLTVDCRVDALLALRTQVVEALGERVSLNDFVVKAVAGALQDVPELNAVWTPESVQRHTAVDIAVAVALDDGLITPVVRDVGGRALAALSRDLRDLAIRARNRDLRQYELEGGTFTVSNLGMYGTERVTAIINPPHAGILAIGAATRRPVVDRDEVAVGTVMTVTLSADHRVVDGATGARWLSAFVQRIENPLRILT